MLSGILLLSAAFLPVAFPPVAGAAEPESRFTDSPGEIFVRVVEPSAPSSGEVVVGNRAPQSSFAAAEPLRFALPEYPRAARLSSQEGVVRACFTIDEQGRIVEPSVRSSSGAQFDRAVLAALTNSRFDPARVDGRPVRSTACRTWRFVLDGRSLESRSTPQQP